MPIKVGFSSSVCPQWDIHDIVTKANELGFYGVELGTVRDELHLPVAEDLQTDKDIDAVRKLFESNSVELVSLASKYSLESSERHVARRCFDRNVENIELAGKLNCPFVRVPLGKGVEREPADRTLARVITPLNELARIAARNQVTLLMCNTPSFPDSRDIWFAVDGANHPRVQAGWNPVLGRAVKDSPTLAVKRLGARLRMVAGCDAKFDARGTFEGFQPIGKGNIDFGLAVDLLKGILFDGYIMLDWPQAHLEKFPAPDDALPEALAFLLERIKHQDPALTAYKKDSNAPNWSGAPTAFVQRQVAGAAVAEDAAQEEGHSDPGEAKQAGPRVAKGGDPRIAKLVAEAVAKVRAARAAKGK